MNANPDNHLVFCTCRPKLIGKYLREHGKRLSTRNTTFLIPQPTLDKFTPYFIDKLKQYGKIVKTSSKKLTWETLAPQIQKKLMSKNWENITFLQQAFASYDNIHKIGQKIAPKASFQIFAPKQIVINFSSISQFQRFKIYKWFIEYLVKLHLYFLTLITIPVFKVYYFLRSSKKTTKTTAENEKIQKDRFKTDSPTTAICIATCRRKKELYRLLQSLETMQVPFADEKLIILIADNDKNQGALKTWDKFSQRTRFSTRYIVEPRPGVPFVRNQALASLPNSVENAIFVDDDEIVTENWLVELLKAQQETGSALVGGPVLQEYPEEVPEWVKKYGLVNRDRYITGTPLTRTRTGNLLINKSILNSEHKFDESYGMKGGSDVDFTSRLYKNGHSICWADNAPVKEIPHIKRCNFRWYLKRNFRNGSALTQIKKKDNQKNVKLVNFINSHSKLLSLISFNQAHSKFLQFTANLAIFLGRCWAIAGLEYQEYMERHRCD